MASLAHAIFLSIEIIQKIFEEKPMSAVSAFTTENYHCKPLMTDVIAIHMTDVTVIHQVNM